MFGCIIVHMKVFCSELLRNENNNYDNDSNNNDNSIDLIYLENFYLYRNIWR